MIVRLLNYGLVILLLCMCACDQQSKQITPLLAEKGVLDLTNWDFERDGPVNLNGEYEFYWNQLLNPEDFIQYRSSSKTHYIAVPRTWNNFEYQGKAIPGDGFATYRLKVLLNNKINTGLAVKLLETSTSYNLFINGQKLSSAGVVGKTAASTKPGYHPEIIGLQSNEGLLDLVVQISNFSHKLGGAWETIALGTRDQLEKNKELKIAYDLFLFGSIFYYGTVSFRSIFSEEKRAVYTIFWPLLSINRPEDINNGGETYPSVLSGNRL